VADGLGAWLPDDGIMRVMWILCLLLGACTVDGSPVEAVGGGGGPAVMAAGGACPVDILDELRGLEVRVQDPAAREMLDQRLREVSNPALLGASLSARELAVGHFRKAVDDLAERGRLEASLARDFRDSLDCLRGTLAKT
jgi:hypothetical protein